jgi:hypothetical protein
MLRNGANSSEENMRFTLAIFYLFAGAMSALPQSGVSTQRDMYGNLVRSTGTYSPRGKAERDRCDAALSVCVEEMQRQFEVLG